MSTTETKTAVAEGSAPAPVSEVPELAPVVAVEEPKAEPTTTEPEVAAPAELIKEDTEAKQPTTTHAASGTAHSDAEIATKADGTLAKPDVVPEVEEPVETKKEAAVTESETPAAAPSTEVAAVAAPAEGSKAVVVEDPKDKEKKSPVKEKAEKTKVEGKGFLAKLFGSKEKSPKKPKVKTPKTEKADPLATAAPIEEAAPAATATETEAVAESSTPAPEVTGAAITTDSAVAAPITEAPAVSTMDTKPEVPVAKETEIPVAPAAVETPAETSAAAVTEPKTEAAPATKEEVPRGIKATRRLSTRFTSFVHKIGGKRDGQTTPPVEKEDKEAAKPTAAVAAVSDEAPKLDEPAPAVPLKMEETKTTAPPAGPVVSTAA